MDLEGFLSPANLYRHSLRLTIDGDSVTIVDEMYGGQYIYDTITEAVDRFFADRSHRYLSTFIPKGADVDGHSGATAQCRCGEGCACSHADEARCD